MSNSLEQKISELLDNELTSEDQDSLLRSFKKNDDMKQKIRRYSLIGDAMRKNLPAEVKHNLASRISKAIESEPTLLFPNTRSLNNPEPKKIPPRVKPIPATVIADEPPRKSSWSAMGLATAATFAMASVIGYVVFSNQINLTNELSISDNVLAKQELKPLNTQAQLAANPVTLQVNTPAVTQSVAAPSVNTTEVFSIATRSTPLVVVRELDQDSEWMRLNEDGGVRVEQFQNQANSADGIQRFPQSKIPYGQVVRYGAQWAGQ